MDGRRKKDDGAAGSVDISTLERFAGVKTLAEKGQLKNGKRAGGAREWVVQNKWISFPKRCFSGGNRL